MINNNKILTVSYGTFSCTLEGFDDSFGTMKAIAEYFRDLAADDRYFGAEPAQPDAQMLARIAQREISRHVEAREDEGRIVLSAQTGATEPTALAPASASPAPAPAAEAPTVAAPPVEAQPPAEATLDDADVLPIETTAPAEAREQKAPVQEDAPQAESTPQEAPAPSEAFEEKEAAQDDAVAAEADAPLAADIVRSLPDTEVKAFFADSDTDDAAVEDFDVEDMPDVAPVSADSIADKLKRIRAVVSQQAETEASPAYTEDEHAEAEISGSAVSAVFADTDDLAADEAHETDIVAATLRDIEDALDTDDALEQGEASDLVDEDEEEDDDVAALLTRLESEGETPDEAIATGTESDDLAFEDDATDNILASMDSEDDADEDDEMTSASRDEDEDECDQSASENLFDGADAGDDYIVQDTADAEAPAPAAPRTRVIKVKRATLDAAIEAGKLEAIGDADDAQPSAPLADRSTLSDEAEAELARELAELEADMGAADADDEDMAQDDAAEDVSLTRLLAENHAVEDAPHASVEEDAAEIPVSADDDFSRLMDEADQQMDEPESATRRDAFAHLRAAVAAKKADEAVGGETSDDESDEAYRDDLANVVRPRRPVTSGNRTERPSDQRPAPLKLVAEQRIDVDKPAVDGPVRPRRVAAVVDNTADDAPTDAVSFERFAEDMGATSLQDLLEAAAAYLSFVEGHQQFSRPQLMTKVRLVEKENFTREDGLRSFGKLLREGKIEKIKGGRFQASEQIGFKPDARAAG